MSRRDDYSSYNDTGYRGRQPYQTPREQARANDARAYNRNGGRYGASTHGGNNHYANDPNAARSYVDAEPSRSRSKGRNAAGSDAVEKRRLGSSRDSFSHSSDSQDFSSSTSNSSSRTNRGRASSRDMYQSQDAASYSRGGGAYSTKEARKRGKGKGKRGLGIPAKIGIVLGCLLLVAGIGVFAYIKVIQGNLNSGVSDDLRNALVETNYSKQPFYMLLMGVDSSEERGSAGYDTTDARSDSMMLVRIDCPNHKVTMISLHRDTMVNINGKLQKINSAHEIGGAAKAVEVVSAFAGVDISHYAELNFDAFRDMVDAVGGVEVEVPMEIDDDLAGGYVPAGKQTLNGTQALILCRARHAYDEYGDGDVYRAANQRLVLGALAKKILSSDILTIANTVNACSKYVTTDLSVTDIIGIAQAMRGLNPATDIYSAMEPTDGVYYEGDGWYEMVLEEEWAAMMERVKKGLPPTTEDIVSSTGSVLASTGSGTIDILGGDSSSTALPEGSVSVPISSSDDFGYGAGGAQ